MVKFRDSNLDEAWLAQAMAENPPFVKPDGTMVSGPVRIGYCQIARPGKQQMGDDGKLRDGKYEVEALYPYSMDQMTTLYGAWYQEARRAHPNKFQADGQFYGMEFPFRDQAAKGNKPGYTPGLIFHKVSTQRQPVLVDANYNEIRDPQKEIYSGCWAILCMNFYDYDNRKQGVSFGLLTFMKIADDLRTYNASANPQQAFQGVNITPNYSPKAAMMGAAGGAPLPGQPPRGPSPMPQSYGQAPQQGYPQAPVAPSYPAQPPAPPQMGYPQPPQAPAAPSYPTPPAPPQQGYAQPPQQGYNPPQPPAPTYPQPPQGYAPPGGFPAPQGASPPPPPPPPPYQG